jgi:hypothetical protein
MDLDGDGEAARGGAKAAKAEKKKKERKPKKPREKKEKKPPKKKKKLDRGSDSDSDDDGIVGEAEEKVPTKRKSNKSFKSADVIQSSDEDY